MKYPILQFFKYENLPAHLQDISKPFSHLAESMAETLPFNAETSTALRKLLEARDCAVRAVLFKQEMVVMDGVLTLKSH
jgi:hypothetical protein